MPPAPLPVLFNPPASPVSFAQPPIAPAAERFTFAAGGGEVPYSWHLSVMNDGQPREVDPPNEGVMTDAGPLVFDQASWDAMNLGSSRWIVNDGTIKPNVDVFGTPGAIPVYGDFVGNGTTQMGVFIDGEWFIDVNGDGKWDDGDLYAKLGNAGDMPVVGDWDGDGKDDIGVFGPLWAGDSRPIDREPGLPKPTNPHRGVMKNMPPLADDAASEGRTVKREATGKLRADVVDHVFQFGQAGDVPVVGDWTGSGVRTVGIFRDGVWYLDIHGTGKWDGRRHPNPIRPAGRHPRRRRLGRQRPRLDRRLPRRRVDSRHATTTSATTQGDQDRALRPTRRPPRGRQFHRHRQNRNRRLSQRLAGTAG